MFFRLFLLFTLVPVIELAILIKLGAYYGVAPTLFLVVSTGVIGAFLARREGMNAWIRIQKEMLSGRFPGNDIIDGFLILIAGVVLLTPGLLTDILGLLILFPVTRAFFREMIKRKIKKMMQAGQSSLIFFIR
ncbi:MAG: FxsA family protein [Candidatus Aureabacteria bacterium]|nr:FxsA family protein [Candidatus Auribacterota bacterium]